MAIINVENANTATYFVAQTTLRNVLGTKKLSELLSEREQISEEMQVYDTKMAAMWVWLMCIFVLFKQILDEATDPWGVKVEKVEMYVRRLIIMIHDCYYYDRFCRKDVSLPQQLQRAMAAEAEASREARAKVSILILHHSNKKLNELLFSLFL